MGGEQASLGYQVDGVAVPVWKECAGRGEVPEYLLWLGCSPSLDDRARKIALSAFRVLHAAGVSWAILGEEERCSGDPARRSGNELLFQLLAMQNIETFQRYGIRRVITLCPHCYNTFRHEYPQLGYSFEEVWHITQFVNWLVEEGRLHLSRDARTLPVTFHDPCYLGRVNGEFDAPRNLVQAVGGELREMERNRWHSFCCGAGGAQVFKEEESGDQPVYRERVREALRTGARIVVTACPFCMLMMRDGVRELAEGKAEVKDVVELVAERLSGVEGSGQS